MVPGATDSFHRILEQLFPPTARQVAALCWRHEGDGIEHLLVTTRRTRRWTPPKGGLIDGRTEAESAEIEAWEEAGVTGEVSSVPLGVYETLKYRDGRGWEKIAVVVFPLLVQRVETTFPEKGARRRRWFSPDAAGRAVREPALKAMIASFAG